MAAEMYAGSEWDPENPRMHIGTQRFSTSDEHLEFLARCGVTNMALNDAREITPDPSRGWTVEEIVEKKEKAAKHGITVEMVALPVQHLNVDGSFVPEFMRGNRIDGEKEIEIACDMVRAAADAGIPALKYFLCEMENQRTEAFRSGGGAYAIPRGICLRPMRIRRGMMNRLQRNRTGKILRSFWSTLFPLPPNARCVWPVIRAIPGCRRVTRVLIACWVDTMGSRVL